MPFYVTSKIHPGQKCRVHTWFDTAQLVEKFGIEAKVGTSYCHVISGNTPLLFDTKDQAAAAISAALHSKTADSEAK
jgi:hypothetical protein